MALHGTRLMADAAAKACHCLAPFLQGRIFWDWLPDLKAHWNVCMLLLAWCLQVGPLRHLQLDCCYTHTIHSGSIRPFEGGQPIADEALAGCLVWSGEGPQYRQPGQCRQYWQHKRRCIFLCQLL